MQIEENPAQLTCYFRHFCVYIISNHMRRRRSINFFRVCGRRQPVLFPGKYLCKKTELHLCYEPMTCKGWWKKTKNFVALVYFYYVFPNIIIECIPINEKRKPSQWSFSQNPLLKRVLTTIFFFHGYKGNLENYFMEDVLILKRQLCYLRNLKESHTKLVGTSCVEYQTETFWRRIDIQEVLQHSENRFVYKGTTIENITCKHTICQGLEFFL